MENTRYKIMLVEDDKLDQTSFKQLIEDKQLPYNCTIAGSVSQALSILGSEWFDIIISDYQLGDGTAFDILDSVKNIPLVIVTGSGDEEIAVRAWKAGADDYLIKDPKRNYLKTLAITVEKVIKHKKAQQALRESEARYRSLTNDVLDSSKVGILILDSDFKVVWVNKASELYFGLCRDKIIGKDKRKLIRKQIKNIFEHPEDFAAKVLATYDNNNYIEDFECHVLPCEGREERWLNHWSQPIRTGRYAGGRIEHYTDITERKQAEGKLRHAAEEWRTTFDSITDLVSIQDKSFKLVRVNRALADAFKTEPRELIGKSCCKLFHGTKEPPADCPHKQTLDTRRPQSVEFFEPHLGIYVEASTSPIFGENGEIIASVHIAKDIGNRKRAEEALEVLNEELKTTVKKLTVANRALKDFAHIIAHDLKAPLRAIATLSDWISTDYADKFDEQGREQVKLLVKRAERMSRLIDGILQYSEAGYIKQKEEEVDLNTLLSEVICGINPPANIEVACESKLPAIICDKTHLIQIFQNLLSNAVRYIDKPKGQIKVGCGEEDGFWKFSVSDNGPGIEEKYFEKIFKIFQTLSPRDEVEATGIGLSVVKKIIEMHGGRVWVESQVGDGSTFFFTLPKQDKVIPDAQLQSHTAR